MFHMHFAVLFLRYIIFPSLSTKTLIRPSLRAYVLGSSSRTSIMRCFAGVFPDMMLVQTIGDMLGTCDLNRPITPCSLRAARFRNSPFSINSSTIPGTAPSRSIIKTFPISFPSFFTSILLIFTFPNMLWLYSFLSMVLL